MVSGPIPSAIGKTLHPFAVGRETARDSSFAVEADKAPAVEPLHGELRGVAAGVEDHGGSINGRTFGVGDNRLRRCVESEQRLESAAANPPFQPSPNESEIGTLHQTPFVELYDGQSRSTGERDLQHDAAGGRATRH